MDSSKSTKTSEVCPKYNQIEICVIKQDQSSIIPFSFFEKQAIVISQSILIFVVASICIFKLDTLFSVMITVIFMSLNLIYLNECHNRLMCKIKNENNKISEIKVISESQIAKLKKETEASKKENQNMVSNVAHDLKTPLSVISTSLQIIKYTVSEYRKGLSTGNVTETVEKRLLDSIDEEIKSMNTINIFMVGSINRVLDASKLQNGMKLVPKYETINLMEALDMPISCMRAVQSTIKVELKSVDPSVCSHIVTDKQWFQESMLCLLSNAVKYSSQGEVAISLSRVSLSDLPIAEKEKVSPISSHDYCDSPRSTSELLTPRSTTIVSLLSNFMLLVEVKDTGIGISKEVMDELFSPFKQAQRLAGGTGLGLYSMTRRLESSQGYYGVRARSDGIQGSIFWFAIPYKADPLTAAYSKTFEEASDINSFEEFGNLSKIHRHTPNFLEKNEREFAAVVESSKKIEESLILAETSIKNASGTERSLSYKSQKSISTQNGTHLNILLVDDSFSIIKVVGNLLRKNGHRVCDVLNGEEALNILIEVRNNPVKNPFDVVIVDLQMPVMDGFECAKRLRKIEKELKDSGVGSPHQLMIACSANSDDETSELAYEAGVDGFLGKPLDIESLMTLYKGLRITNHV